MKDAADAMVQCVQACDQVVLEDFEFGEQVVSLGGGFQVILPALPEAPWFGGFGQRMKLGVYRFWRDGFERLAAGFGSDWAGLSATLVCVSVACASGWCFGVVLRVGVGI